MAWGEAVRLLAVLGSDPSSQFAASSQGWDFPISREALATLDLFDLMHKVNAKRKPKPHPGRPGTPDIAAERMGNIRGRSSDEVRGILAASRSGAAQV